MTVWADKHNFSAICLLVIPFTTPIIISFSLSVSGSCRSSFSEEVCTIDSNVSLICSAESYTEMTPSYIFKTEASAKECCKAMHFNERPSRLFLNCIIDDIPANPGSIINISGLRHDNNAGSCCISATSAASILRVDSFFNTVNNPLRIINEGSAMTTFNTGFIFFFLYYIPAFELPE